MDILLTNHRLPSVYSESVPRSTSKASPYNYAEKYQRCRCSATTI